MRCRPRDTAPGEETCTTRSTAPMSMPSSRLDVATRPRSVPALSWSSTSCRRAFDKEPWWASTSSSTGSSRMRTTSSGRSGSEGSRSSGSWPAALRRSARTREACSSLRLDASRSASRRALTNTIVEWCASTRSSSRGWIAGQIDRRVGAVPANRSPSSTTCPSSAMSSPGTTTSSSIGLDTPASTISTCRGSGRTSPVAGWTTSWWPPRNRAISSSGRWVADRAMRWGGRKTSPRSSAPRRTSSSRRSSDTARWLPRLVGASAWISSMITVSTSRSRSRAFEVSSRNRDSGVVISTSGGRRSIRWRSVGGVSPVRTPTSRSRNGSWRRSAASAAQRRPQVALDVHGQRLQRRHVQHAGAALPLGLGGGDQSVDRRQERRQRLAGPGGGEDEGVAAVRDGRPPQRLRVRGRRERGVEPLPDCRREVRQHRMGWGVAGGRGRGGHDRPTVPPRCDSRPRRARGHGSLVSRLARSRTSDSHRRT